MPRHTRAEAMTTILALFLAASTCPATASFPPAGSCHYTGDAGTDPDPACTPGEFDPDLTVAQLCSEGQSRRCKDNPAVARAYSARPGGEDDHFVPLCAGGTNGPKNRWQQPAAEFRHKDVVEAAACRGICNGTLSLDAARAMIRDWREAYKRLKQRSSK